MAIHTQVSESKRWYTRRMFYSNTSRSNGSLNLVRAPNIVETLNRESLRGIENIKTCFKNRQWHEWLEFGTSSAYWWVCTLFGVKKKEKFKKIRRKKRILFVFFFFFSLHNQIWWTFFSNKLKFCLVSQSAH